MVFSTLNEWLTWIDSIHSKTISLGLERVKAVGSLLGVLDPKSLVVIVGGTNGKGSTVAALASIYLAAGYRVGTFTSPYLFKHNEQVHINGEMADDTLFCQAFREIERVRGDVLLTPFEFNTLAALWIFKQYTLDILLLEVGLGGRLDAVNIIDADVTAITSIAIDHVDWLGNTRESIGFEKAGIFRAHKPAVCGDDQPPTSLTSHAIQLQTPLFCQGKDFHYVQYHNYWSWCCDTMQYTKLPYNSLHLQNMSTALMVIHLLQQRLSVSTEAIENGLLKTNLPGRIQIIKGDITEIYDVSHNPAAITLLAKRLQEMHCAGKTCAVFSMLEDKDILNSIKAIQPLIDQWYVAPLNAKRRADKTQLQQAFEQANIPSLQFFPSIQNAYQSAKNEAKSGDRLITFGSFYTLASVMPNQKLY